MKIEEQVYFEILNSNIGMSNESGGLLGGSEGIIERFCIDLGNTSGKTCYYPDVVYLNNVLLEWKREGVTLYGFFHTHTLGRTELSPGDKAYAYAVLKAMPTEIKSLLFPIVIPGTEMVLYRGKLVDNEIVFLREDAILVKIKKENCYGKDQEGRKYERRDSDSPACR